MNYKIFFAIAFIAMFSFSFAQVLQSCSPGANSTYYQDEDTIVYSMKKGWNLVGAGTMLLDCCRFEATAFSVWMPTLQKYSSGTIIDGELKTKNQSDLETIAAESERFAYPQSGAMWIYSKANDCNALLKFSGNQKNGTIPKMLPKGWNFITILPWMVGKKASDLFRNCAVTKANGWIAEAQSWGIASSSLGAQNFLASTFEKSYTGNIVLIYTEKDCTFNYFFETGNS